MHAVSIIHIIGVFMSFHPGWNQLKNGNFQGLAGELVNVLREAGQIVPDALLKFGTHVKKKVFFFHFCLCTSSDFFYDEARINISLCGGPLFFVLCRTFD